MTDPRYKEYNIVTRNGCVATGIAVYPPFSYYDGVTYKGSAVEVLKMLMIKLGFCYTFVTAPTGWGARLPNGTWTGLMGLAQRREVEILMAPVARTYSRYEIIDYSETLVTDTYSIAYPRPTIKPNFAGFVMPYTLQSWLTIMAAVVLLTALTHFINHCTPIGKSDEDRTWWMERGFRLASGWVYRPLIQQPIIKEAKCFGGRLLMVFWLFVALIIAETYKSNLSAQLIVPKVDIPFDSLEELVNQVKFKWTFYQGSTVESFFKAAYNSDPNSVMGKGWARRGEQYTTAKQIVTFILEKKMAGIEGTTTLERLLSDDFSQTGKCRYALASETMFTLGFTYGLKKKSRLNELIDPYILRMVEAGIITQVDYGKYRNITRCTVPPGKENGQELRAFVLQDFMGMFSILFAGWVISTIVFVTELLLRSRTVLSNFHRAVGQGFHKS